METLFFITTYRSQEDLELALKKEIHPDILVEPWREDAKGFHMMYLPEGVDFYKTYELFHFLQFNVTYINVPVEFYVTEDSGFGNKKSRLQREPLASWKTIPRDYVMDPVPVDRMTGQIEERLGLGKILSTEKQRTNAPLIGMAQETNQKRTYIIEFGSEKKDKETVKEIEVDVYRNGEKVDWEAELHQKIRIELHELLTQKKRQWVFARKLGMKAIIAEMMATEIQRTR